MTRQPDLLAGLRELAPKWARWFCVSWTGSAWWQAERGLGLYWYTDARTLGDPAFFYISPGDTFAIHLPTGTFHWRRRDGVVVDVTRAEWEAMP